MQQIKILLFLLIGASFSYASNPLAGRHQLLVVTTNSWEGVVGELQCYERLRDDAAWQPVGEPKPVVLGSAGLAWGLGLHPKVEKDLPHKIEGDKKSPAGIFPLGRAFGLLPAFAMQHLRLDYLPLHEGIEAVDDPTSFYYNQIVDRNKVTPDWRSSEKMGQEPLYQLGLEVHHNFPHPLAGKGSAIFLHVWRQKDKETAGCTAMSLENLSGLLSWLEKEKNPALVQLPFFEYKKFQQKWNLPNMMKRHLVNLAHADPTIVLDIRYATDNHFLKFPLYPKPACYLHEKAAEALLQVQKDLSALGLGLKVFDGYRPLSVQQMAWDAIQDDRYVSNPAKNKGRHTRGTAVDATLVDQNGNELEMPSAFDDFSEKAHSDYPHASKAALTHRTLLHEVMKKHHFTPLPTEWWHFDFEGWYDDQKFPPLDISFEELE